MKQTHPAKFIEEHYYSFDTDSSKNFMYLEDAMEAVHLTQLHTQKDIIKDVCKILAESQVLSSAFIAKMKKELEKEIPPISLL